MFKVYHQKLANAAVAGESGEGKPYSTDFAFDVSYLYKLPNKAQTSDKFNFGFNIANIGPPISFIDEDQADPAPTNIRMGIFANLYDDEFTKLPSMIAIKQCLFKTTLTS